MAKKDIEVWGDVKSKLKSKKMFKQVFQCKVQEPLVLFKKAKSEQTTESLDYIPGSVFRGAMAAALFKDDADDSLINQIIFNNSVQFGDAHVCINGKRSLQLPFSYYMEVKEGNNELELFHEISNWSRKLKQKREGYFIFDNGEILLHKVETDDRLKSARSAENRASKEGSMYFYRFIDEGQIFEFEVRSVDEALLQKVVDKFHGKELYFGKSKQAEFGGKVLVTPVNGVLPVDTVTASAQIIYAESNLCFLNQWGEFTSEPSIEQLVGNSETEIDWSRSQLRFRTYAPYNAHRQAYDFERLIIEKGSVFYLKQPVNVSSELVNNGVGCFLTEGFGRILIDPDFLTEKTYVLNGQYKPTEPELENDATSEIISGLQRMYSMVQRDAEIYVRAGQYVNNCGLRGISASQWGGLYNSLRKVQNATEYDHVLFNEQYGLCVAGVNNPWVKYNAEDKFTVKWDELENYSEKEKINFFRVFAKRMLSQKRLSKNES